MTTVVLNQACTGIGAVGAGEQVSPPPVAAIRGQRSSCPLAKRGGGQNYVFAPPPIFDFESEAYETN